MRKLEDMRILIVDDSHISLILIQKSLVKYGYKNLVLAESAADAFNILGMEREESGAVDIDLILMDIMMKDMNGIEACQHIKMDDRFNNIPVIMVTGISKKDSLEQAFSAGAIDYVIKPMNAVELKARVTSALKLKREIDERKNVEKTLRESREQYRELFENANDVIFTIDLKGRCASINKMGEKVSGFTRDEIIGMNFRDIVAPEHAELASRMMEQKLKGDLQHTVYELDIISK